MALSFFDDKSNPPTDEDVASAVGRTSKLWNELHVFVAERFDPISEEWCYSGKPYGWALRLRHKKRPVVYLIPQSKQFLAAFVLGEKAVKEALASNLSPEMLDLVKAAKKYPEGTGFRMEVRTKKALAAAKKMAEIKMTN